MDLDISIHEGAPDRAVAVFIHGLGMHKDLWVNPMGTRFFAGNIPLPALAAVPPKPSTSAPPARLTIGDRPRRLDSIWAAARRRGHSLIAWSQRRPGGPMSSAVEELEFIISLADRIFPSRPIVLVCHSRGGLIARKFLEKRRPGVTALITLASPHGGSSLARFSQILSPLIAPIKRLLPKESHGSVTRIFRYLTELAEGKAALELLPGSDFLRGLRDEPSPDMVYRSLGGTRTGLCTVYSWKKNAEGSVRPVTLFTFPDSFLGVLPRRLVPDELIPGRGDFLVSLESSRLPWAKRHLSVDANHLTILWDRKTLAAVLEVLDSL